MAEKEERIVFLKTKPKGECPCQIDKDYCKETCWVKGKCSLGMTRAEAIERLGREIARQYDPRKPNKEEYERIWEKELFPATKKYYLEQGESVLNALLEGK